MDEIVTNGIESVLNKRYAKIYTDTGGNAEQVIVPLTFIKVRGTGNSEGGFLYHLVYGSTDVSGYGLTVRPIVVWNKSENKHIPGSINPISDIGKKLAANADKIAKDIDNYIKKHTKEITI